jgi:dihydrolipoamide dehydrogenase
MSTYDLAIIGSGPGGYVAAIRAAQLNLSTVLIEKENLGGVCLNWGCIPTKALLRSAEVYSLFKQASSFGIQVETVTHDFQKIIQRSRKIAEINSKGVEYLMKKNEIKVVKGSAQLVDNQTIEVTAEDAEKSSITANHIIIATGGRSRTLPGAEFDGKQIITSKEALSMPKQPKSMIIIGAGAIGVEFAYFYNKMGTKVMLIEMLDSILPIEDKEISSLLEKIYIKDKIEIFTSTRVDSVIKKKDLITVTIENKGESKTLSADLALVAIGIQGNIENLNLNALGIDHERSFIKVNEWYETNVKGVYAIGDIIGPPLLAHVASHEGIICAEKIAGIETYPLNYDAIPGCTYCQPQVASIGFTEEKAKESGYEISIGKFPYSASGKARAIGEREGMVKLIFDKKYGELLGAHIIGAEATELIAELGIAKTLETTPLELSRTIHAHPTLSEMIMEAASNSLGEAIHI